ncbi:MAG: hypothetical protein ACD_28C00330G0001 [uncultured bacterium]|nr:MAG: hypothetical protein ACD_28C00330G0001 [uncultured bacterium]KKT76042.1 MAG: hypothetical protein UW70_C0023G0020 [Candidatus Peregrinibacteria bacterium GW2011_GWA2_44_7]
MLINSTIRGIVDDIEEGIEVGKNPTLIDRTIENLIRALRETSQRPDNQKRYANYSGVKGEMEPYPLESGYAKTFDPLVDEEGFYDQWVRSGVVVHPQIISESTCQKTIERVHVLMQALSEGQCDLTQPETYSHIPVDENNIPVLSRGFFEIYHDDALAQLRQTIRTYIHHVVLWGTTDLWTTFDRFGVKLPHHTESKALPLHVDQNPLTNPGFTSIQGVLALSDCPTECGTLLVVPGSKQYFSEYAHMEKRGEFVQLNTLDPIAEVLQQQAQPIPLRAGSLVSWDSRTTHANTENLSEDIRMVAYIAAGPAREDRPDLISLREEAFRSGLAHYNHEAWLRVSTKPRFTNPTLISQVRHTEQLHLLGQLLYGKRSYRTC